MNTETIVSIVGVLFWVRAYCDPAGISGPVEKLLVILGAIGGIFVTIQDILMHSTDYIAMVCHLSIALICLVMLFNDWRKNRKKKSSKVLSRIKNVGHRLVLVPIPAKR